MFMGEGKLLGFMGTPVNVNTDTAILHLAGDEADLLCLLMSYCHLSNSNAS